MFVQVYTVRKRPGIPKTPKRLQRAEASSVVLLSDEDMDFIQFAMGEVCSPADEGFLNRLAFGSEFRDLNCDSI